MHRNRSSESRDDSALGEVLRGTEELLRRTASFGDAGIEAGRDRVKRQWNDMGGQAAEWGRSATGSVQRLARAADECAHRHAWESITAAALVGMAVGACLMKRVMRN